LKRYQIKPDTNITTPKIINNIGSILFLPLGNIKNSRKMTMDRKNTPHKITTITFCQISGIHSGLYNCNIVDNNPEHKADNNVHTFRFMAVTGKI
jgi:hypothetical protein